MSYIKDGYNYESGGDPLIKLTEKVLKGAHGSLVPPRSFANRFEPPKTCKRRRTTGGSPVRGVKLFLPVPLPEVIDVTRTGRRAADLRTCLIFLPFVVGDSVDIECAARVTITRHSSSNPSPRGAVHAGMSYRLISLMPVSSFSPSLMALFLNSGNPKAQNFKATSYKLEIFLFLKSTPESPATFLNSDTYASGADGAPFSSDSNLLDR